MIMVSRCAAQQPIPTERFGLSFVPVISGPLIGFQQSVVDLFRDSFGRVDGIIGIQDWTTHDQIVSAGPDRFRGSECASLIVSRIVAGPNARRDD
jgi:hypothetical protein